MSRFFDLISKPAREMGGYTPSAPFPPGTTGRLIKLDSNENPFGPSPRAIDAMRSTLAGVNSYPEDDCTVLRRKLAAHHELPPEQVLVTAGSTALLSLLCQTLLGPGLNAVTSERSFIVYSMVTHSIGSRLIEVPMRENTYDLEAILAAINADTRLVFVANPNNPTGTLVDAEAVERFVAQVPGHVVVVLDEAYYEFAQHFALVRGMKYSKSLDFVKQGAGVVVLRTFSKAHGLAGLRVGYGMGPAELLAYCARMRNTFSVSSVAQAAALAAIHDAAHVRRAIENNLTQAQLLWQSLMDLGYRVVPTSANFLYCDLGENASPFARALREEGVSVRPLEAWGAPDCIRVSIGTPEQNQALLKAARRVAPRHAGPQISGRG